MLYTFQAVPPPIIRSSKLYTQYRVFVELFLLLTSIVSELEILYMFQAVPPPNIRSSKLCTPHRGFVEFFLLLTAIVSELEQAVRSRKSSTNTRYSVYSFELLMMGGGTA